MKLAKLPILKVSKSDVLPFRALLLFLGLAGVLSELSKLSNTLGVWPVAPVGQPEPSGLQPCWRFFIAMLNELRKARSVKGDLVQVVRSVEMRSSLPNVA